jgi:hypothetical protein
MKRLVYKRCLLLSGKQVTRNFLEEKQCKRESCLAERRQEAMTVKIVLFLPLKTSRTTNCPCGLGFSSALLVSDHTLLVSEAITDSKPGSQGVRTI